MREILDLHRRLRRCLIKLPFRQPWEASPVPAWLGSFRKRSQSTKAPCGQSGFGTSLGGHGTRRHEQFPLLFWEEASPVPFGTGPALHQMVQGQGVVNPGILDCRRGCSPASRLRGSTTAWSKSCALGITPAGPSRPTSTGLAASFVFTPVCRTVMTSERSKDCWGTRTSRRR